MPKMGKSKRITTSSRVGPGLGLGLGSGIRDVRRAAGLGLVRISYEAPGEVKKNEEEEEKDKRRGRQGVRWASLRDPEKSIVVVYHPPLWETQKNTVEV